MVIIAFLGSDCTQNSQLLYYVRLSPYLKWDFNLILSEKTKVFISYLKKVGK